MTIRLALQRSKATGLNGVVDLMRVHRQAYVDRRRLQRALRTPEGVRSHPQGSSISDQGLYPVFCRLAARDTTVFERFRRSLIYRSVLEHVSEDQGRAYIAELADPDLLAKRLEAVVRTDGVGNPYQFPYGGFGVLSPSTLRYVKVLADLERLFGPLTGMSLAEIGVGYGGQCRVISAAASIAHYNLFDIPEVLELAGRFLDAAQVDMNKISGSDGRDPAAGSFDLVISNYAFSELDRGVQEVYLDRVIMNSRRGYVTYNHISPVEWGSLSAHEFAERVPGARILPERPLTHPDNVIVVW